MTLVRRSMRSNEYCREERGEHKGQRQRGCISVTCGPEGDACKKDALIVMHQHSPQRSTHARSGREQFRRSPQHITFPHACGHICALSAAKYTTQENPLSLKEHLSNVGFGRGRNGLRKVTAVGTVAAKDQLEFSAPKHKHPATDVCITRYAIT
jgi:hypothetical protein